EANAIALAALAREFHELNGPGFAGYALHRARAHRHDTISIRPLAVLSLLLIPADRAPSRVSAPRVYRARVPAHKPFRRHEHPGLIFRSDVMADLALKVVPCS